MKALVTIVMLAIFAAAASTQTAFNGISPAKTTKSEVEKILGAPVTKVSETLIEYAPSKTHAQEAAKAGGAMHVYIQYRQGSPIVERAAIVLKGPDPFTLLQQAQKLGPGIMLPFLDARVLAQKSGNSYLVDYVGAPYYYTQTVSQYQGEANIRMEFYSRELYEAAVPKGGCTGTFVGKWNTDLGPLTIRLADDQSGLTRPWAERKVIGIVSNSGFTISGVADISSLRGTWRDGYKADDLSLSLKGRDDTMDNKDFKGTMKVAGNWVEFAGRCVE